MAKNGRIPRDHATVMKLVEHYGTEVYDVIGQPVPSLFTPLESFPPAIKESLEKSLVEINSIYAKTGVSPDSPEAVSIAENVLAKHGFMINSKEISEQ
jgi:hypothetical protein